MEGRISGQPSSQQARDVDCVVQNPERLAVLRQTALLDTPAEEVFDRLTRLAVKILAVPIALVSLVDENRQFFKSCIGLPEPWSTLRQAPLSHSFCQYTVATCQPLVISDARNESFVCNKPAISELGIVAYAGIPLLVAKGCALGSFCVTDSKPRIWTKHELEILEDLTASVVTAIELRLETAEDITARKTNEERLQRSEEQFRLATQAANCGIWDWDIPTGELQWSGEVEKLAGLAPGQFTGTIESFSQILHPDDRTRVWEELEQLMAAREQNYTGEYRFIRPDGEVRWMSGRGQFSYDAVGVPVRFLSKVSHLGFLQNPAKSVIFDSLSLVGNK